MSGVGEIILSYSFYFRLKLRLRHIDVSLHNWWWYGLFHCYNLREQEMREKRLPELRRKKNDCGKGLVCYTIVALAKMHGNGYV